MATVAIQRINATPFPGMVATAEGENIPTYGQMAAEHTVVSDFLVAAAKFLNAPTEFGPPHVVFRTASVKDENGVECKRDTFTVNLETGEVKIENMLVVEGIELPIEILGLKGSSDVPDLAPAELLKGSSDMPDLVPAEPSTAEEMEVTAEV